MIKVQNCKKTSCSQGAKKINFPACPCNQHLLAQKSFLQARKKIFTSFFQYLFLLYGPCLTCSEFTSPIAKSTSPRLSDTTFLMHAVLPCIWLNIKKKRIFISFFWALNYAPYTFKFLQPLGGIQWFTYSHWNSVIMKFF